MSGPLGSGTGLRASHEEIELGDGGSVSGERVAVVIPCFNDGETLAEALESLVDQERSEIVVVDDGSTEASTLQALDEVRGRGVTVVRQENAGLAAARMRGVVETSAPYVLPVDADDALVPGAVERLADALDANLDAVVSWGDLELFGDVIGRVELPLGIDPWKITYVCDMPAQSLVRRSALLAAGGWQLRDGNEDWDLWMTFAERAWRGVYVPGSAYRYRIRSGRMNELVIASHGDHLARLRTRHPSLFAARATNWRRSRASIRARLLFPIVRRAPVSEWNRRRMLHAVDHPRRVYELGRQRRRRISEQ